jgi:CHRD domain
MKHIEYKPFFAVLLALAVIGMAASLATLSVRAQNNDDGVRFFTRLSTFNEVPPKANGAHGTFRATLSEDGTTLNWTFTWEGLTGPPLFAHIHFGLKGGNYPVMTFFCGGPKGNAAIPQKPDCPQSTSGSITGTTTAADIIALNTPNTPTAMNDQALDQHDFAGFLRALRAGSAYANMHTTRFMGGEIRGQIAVNRGEPDDEN